MKKMTAWLLAGVLSVNMMTVPATAAVDNAAEDISLEENEVQDLSLEEQADTGVTVEEETQNDEQEEITGFSSGDVELETESREEAQPEYEEGEVLVLWKDAPAKGEEQVGNGLQIETVFDVTPSGATAEEECVGGVSEAVISRVSSDSYSTEQIMNMMEKRSDVEIVEPNYRVYPTSLNLNDTQKDFLWQLENEGVRSPENNSSVHAQSAWEKEKKESVVVAVLDSGVDYTNPDLAGRMWHNDISYLNGEYGYDFANHDDDPMDDFGHGTHCAGIIAAQANNAYGTAGVVGDADVQVMALKFMGQDGGGNIAFALAAYDYMAEAVDAGVNLVAVNNSWGSVGISLLFDRAMTMLGEKGVLSLTAAGNDGEDNDQYAGTPNNSLSPYHVTVAAADEDGTLASYSCYGKREVDLVAPGSNILSTVHEYVFNPWMYGEERASFVKEYREFSADTAVEYATQQDYYKKAVLSYGSAGQVNGAKGFSEVYLSDGNLEILPEDYIGSAKNEVGTQRATLNWNLSTEPGNEYYLVFPMDEQADENTYANMVYNVTSDNQKEQNTLVYFVQFVKRNGQWTVYKKFQADVDQKIYTSILTNGNGNLKSSNGLEQAVGLYVKGSGSANVQVSINSLGLSDPTVPVEEFGKYDLYSGTSMATPVAVGAVALLKAIYPDMSVLELKSRLLSMTRNVNGLGEVVSSNGLLDLSMIDTPAPVLETAQTEQNQTVLKIGGTNLGDAAGTVEISVGEKEAVQGKVLSWSSKEVKITLDKSWINQILNLKATTADGLTAEFRTYLVSGKKSYTKLYSIKNENCNIITATDGETFYYADGNTLTAVKGTTSKNLMEIPYLMLAEAAGIDDYTMEYVQGCDVVSMDYVNGNLYVVVSYRGSYKNWIVLGKYDVKKDKWSLESKSTAMRNLVSMDWAKNQAFGDDIYYMGGMSEAGQMCSNMLIYHTKTRKWELVKDGMPGKNGAVYRGSCVWNGKMYLLLGTDEDNSFDSNIYVYDGKKWSKAGTLPEPMMHTMTAQSGNYLYMSAVGACQEGIAIGGLAFEGYGDSVIWNAKTNTLKDSGYTLVNRVNDTFVYGTTAGTRLYVVFNRDDLVYQEVSYMPVKEAPVLASSILIQKSSRYIQAGKTLQLKAVITPSNTTDKTVTWKSSNTKYATVSSKGVVTAKKAGIGKTVYITATTANGKKNTRRLIIKK
ncbi:MAG: S8 family serine peptidase [Eubacteriales bacterium]|nr:S8 family serine peptidase [Eubacteriales bacterium]